MATIALKGGISMESKKVSISSKRQITIPQKFFTLLGFNTEAECIMRGNELILRPIKNNTGGEFAEQILKELIDEGYSGYELFDEFRIRQAKVRSAVEAMLEEAKNVANGNGEYMTREEFVKEVAIDSDADEEDGEVPNAETIAAMNEYYQMKAHHEKYKRYASLKDAMDPIEYMGYQEGLEIGIKIGENNVNKSASLKMYQDGYSPEHIAKLLQVSSEQVMEWIEEK